MSKILVTEEDLFYFMHCPMKTYFKKNLKMKDTKKTISLNSIIQDSINYFLDRQSKGDVFNIGDVKNFFDTQMNKLLRNTSGVDTKQITDAFLSIGNFINTVSDNRIICGEHNFEYRIQAENNGYYAGIIDNIVVNKNEQIEMLYIDMSKVMANNKQDYIDMRLKYTLDWLGFYKTYNVYPNIIRVYDVKNNKFWYTSRNNKHFKRATTTINNVIKLIDKQMYYPVENFQCSTCAYKKFCKYVYGGSNNGNFS